MVTNSEVLSLGLYLIEPLPLICKTPMTILLFLSLQLPSPCLDIDLNKEKSLVVC